MKRVTKKRMKVKLLNCCVYEQISHETVYTPKINNVHAQTI